MAFEQLLNKIKRGDFKNKILYPSKEISNTNPSQAKSLRIQYRNETRIIMRSFKDTFYRCLADEFHFNMSTEDFESVLAHVLRQVGRKNFEEIIYYTESLLDIVNKLTKYTSHEPNSNSVEGERISISGDYGDIVPMFTLSDIP